MNINFGKLVYRERENNDCYVSYYSEVTEADITALTSAIAAMGYNLPRTDKFGGNTFYTFEKDGDAIYLAHYPEIGEMRLVEEKRSAYLSYKNHAYECITTPNITQVGLSDYGLSYVIRLSDGTLMVLDGGLEVEADADELMRVITKQNVLDKPVISAWIMTHPHIDHYRVFFPFYEKYGKEVEIRYMLYNFPPTDKEGIEKFTELQSGDEAEYMERFVALVDELNIPVICPHTGQVYSVADAEFKILSSLDDMYFVPVPELNPTSLMFKMELAGQTILWTGDGYFDISKMAERWGEYLKSDIMQLPHHGFCGGREEEYALIDPAVCLAPVMETDAFQTINMYFPHHRYLIYNTNLQEYFSGGTYGSYSTFTLDLPHIPIPNAREELLKRVAYQQNYAGKYKWEFENITLASAKMSFANITIYDSEIDITIKYCDGTEETRHTVCPKRTGSEYDLGDMAINDEEVVALSIKCSMPVLATIS